MVIRQQAALREQLIADGHFFFRASEIGLPAQITDAQSAMIKQAQELPVDPKSKGNRFRCLQYAIYMPGYDQIIFIPPTRDMNTGEEYVSFRQGGENPEFANIVRRFAPMPKSMQNNPALRQIVRADFRLTPFADCRDEAFAMRFHVIRHTVEPGDQAASSPDLVHTDNVLISFVHVIERSNVRGGVNCITKMEHAGKRWNEVPVQDILAQATVTNLFGGYGFLDNRVSHYVSPIEAASDSPGARTILITDIARIQESKNL